ncbi:hypothetical protein SNE40_020459 [Patella caerulea]|uniref:A-kinase-interacting protein 1 n=1 Tax=Patella caerulea TaxID=87958 RepID=A0AAN8GK12_PATCE
MERQEWARNTLERAATLGNDVYYRARRRQIDWPDCNQKQRMKSPSSPKFTSLEEAFSSIQSYLSTTTQSCQKYYKSCVCPSRKDISHCCRFHHNKAYNIQSYPQEDVHMIIPPGSYSVSARSHIDGINQSHIIHIREGQTVDVDFVL